MRKIHRLGALLMSAALLLSTAGCGAPKQEQAVTPPSNSETSETVRPNSLASFRCETIYVPASVSGWLPEIAVVDDKLYYLWCEADGETADEHLDVMDMSTDSAWRRVTDENEVERIKTKLRTENQSYTPLYEEVGQFVVYTDENEDFYLLDTETDRRTNLQLNLEDWRRFSTDHKTYFAFLSAFSITVDGEYANEIRYYELNYQEDAPRFEINTRTDVENDSPYLSITVSAYNDGATAESGMVTTVYSLDLESNEVEKVWSFEETAQYPLATYSRHDNSVYYTQRVENDETGKGDQLFSKNLSTGEILQMSEELFGVNYIVPLDADRIVYVAAEKQSHILSVFLYNKKTKRTTTADLPDDMSIQRLSYNTLTGRLIGSGRYEMEERAAADASNQGMGQRFIPPDYYIYDFTDFDNIHLLYKTENRQLERLASDADGHIIFTQTDTDRAWGAVFSTHWYDVEETALETLDNLDASMYVGEFLFCTENNWYFIGVDESDCRGIYAYDLSTKATRLLFTSEDGWINNFLLM